MWKIPDESKTCSITGLASTSALNAVEKKKISSISDLVKKTVYIKCKNMGNWGKISHGIRL